MTHDDLVRRAARWLRNTRGCGVVLTEFTSALPEVPDAIGWRVVEVWSILLECKATRSDFLADRRKTIRHPHVAALGQERWYLTPPGLVRPDELPVAWGLLECHERVVRVVVPHPHARYPSDHPGAYLDQAVAHQELSLTLSALRRHHCRACQGEIDRRHV